jgi:hypothetical protein
MSIKILNLNDIYRDGEQASIEWKFVVNDMPRNGFAVVALDGRLLTTTGSLSDTDLGSFGESNESIFARQLDAGISEYTVNMPTPGAGVHRVEVRVLGHKEDRDVIEMDRAQDFMVEPVAQRVSLVRGPFRAAGVDEQLWVLALASSRAFGFDHYRKFVVDAFCCEYGEKVPHCFKDVVPEQKKKEEKPSIDKSCEDQELSMLRGGVRAYEQLKRVSEVFMQQQCSFPRAALDDAAKDFLSRAERSHASGDKVGANITRASSELARIPLDYLIDCIDEEKSWKHLCFVELIWSYWMEEGMLVQTLKAIAQRFQNRRANGARDPLANFELDPLRALNNMLWGYVEDEQHRLSVLRRAHEYEHHYGLPLYGKAVAGLRPADRRSKFLESFHNLLAQCVRFYRQVDDLTVNPDAFPLLNGIKETHYLLGQGAHNQFGDLPEVARREMLLEQWLLGRPEMREFLRGRSLVPYPEPWMTSVDTMKSLQGWSDTSVVHFRDLATFGETILITIRYGNWAKETNPLQATNWAVIFRQEIQGYVHAYRVVTGVDLTTEATHPHQLHARNVPPAEHLKRRLLAQAGDAR